MLDKVIASIKAALPGLPLRENEPMSRHCSFRIGGPARALAEPRSGEECAALCRLLRSLGEEPLVIGNGTNLLITDSPLERVVLKIGEGLADISVSGCRVTAGAGAKLSLLASAALAQGLTGLEFAAGIPGSLGGAVVMDAGAYGGEMRNVVERTVYLDPAELEIKELRGAEHDFSYRHSFFSDKNAVVLESGLLLRPGEAEAIRARMNELAAKRRASQPLELPSAGSTFKRPASGYAAALIDGAGLKGFAVGGARVSEKHAGFVVNTGGATFADVLAVMDHVRETVLRRSGVELSPEVRIIRG